MIINSNLMNIRSMFFQFFFCWATILSIVKAQVNLICNGDFEAYNTMTTVSASDGTSVTYSMISQNYSCWYRLPHGQIEIQRQNYGYYTKNVELSDLFTNQYALCQNFSTKIGSNYSLSLDFFTPKQLTSSTAFVYLNNALVTSGKKIGYLESMKLTYNFTASLTVYMLCIKGTIQKNSNTPIFADYSPMIDNVSVIQVTSPVILNSTNITVNSSINGSTNIWVNVTNTTFITPNYTNSSSINISNIVPVINENITSISNIYFQVNLSMTTNDQQGYIQFLSLVAIPLQVFLILQSKSTILISGQVQTQVTFSYNPDGTFTTRIYVQRAYLLKDISFQIAEQFINENTKINIIVYINGRPIYIYFGAQKSTKSIENFQMYSRVLVNAISKGYDVMKACFCSYFVINIINFYSLTLFYNFLAIRSQPTFSHNSLQKISQIFYVRNSLISFVSRLLNNTSINIADGDFLIKNEKIIDEFYRDYLWFGGMGIQEDFFRNNLEGLCLITFAVLKLLIIKLSFKAFPNLMKIFFGNFSGFVVILLTQLMCLSPMMTVSALQNLLEPGFRGYKCKINLILHIILLFSIIYCPFLIFMNFRFKATKKWRNLFKKKVEIKKNTQIILTKLNQNNLYQNSLHIDKNHKVQKRISRRMNKYRFKRPYLKSIKYSLNVIIPAIVVLHNQLGFFLVITPIIVVIAVLFVSKIRQFKTSQKIFQGLIIFILCVHHFCFLFMYLCQKFSDDIQVKFAYVCEIMGVIVIFTVASGGIVEILRFLFRFLSQARIKITKFCKIARQKQQLQQLKTRKNLELKNPNSTPTNQTITKEDYIAVEINQQKKDKNKQRNHKNNNINKFEQKIQKIQSQGKKILIKVCIKKNTNKNILRILYKNPKQKMKKQRSQLQEEIQ